ncbi:MAG: hypothetical protein ACR2JC_19170 [Chloroflexota bacterium]
MHGTVFHVELVCLNIGSAASRGGIAHGCSLRLAERAFLDLRLFDLVRSRRIPSLSGYSHLSSHRHRRPSSFTIPDFVIVAFPDHNCHEYIFSPFGTDDERMTPVSTQRWNVSFITIAGAKARAVV